MQTNIFLEKIDLLYQEKYIDKIFFGNELEFSYIKLKNNFDDKMISIRDIFKFNMKSIIIQINKYFPEININIDFNVPNRNEFIIKKYDETFKYDVYVSISNSQNAFYDCGYDFVNNKNIDNNKYQNFSYNKEYLKIFDNDDNYIDNYKYISSIINLDYYNYFVENNDYKSFLSESIYRLLILLCAINSDEYKLAEIMFIKNNLELKNLSVKVQKFKKIINGEKNEFIDFYEFYEIISPINPETDKDMDFIEFKKYVEDKIMDKIILCDNNIPWKQFELILIRLDSDISKNIDPWKILYIDAVSTLKESLRTINMIINEMNKKKKYIPQYLKEFLEKDLINIENEDLLILIKKKLMDR